MSSTTSWQKGANVLWIRNCRTLLHIAGTTLREHALTRWRHFFARNDVMTAISKGWRHIRNRCVFTWRRIVPNFIPIRFWNDEATGRSDCCGDDRSVYTQQVTGCRNYMHGNEHQSQRSIQCMRIACVITSLTDLFVNTVNCNFVRVFEISICSYLLFAVFYAYLWSVLHKQPRQ